MLDATTPAAKAALKCRPMHLDARGAHAPLVAALCHATSVAGPAPRFYAEDYGATYRHRPGTGRGHRRAKPAPATPGRVHRADEGQREPAHPARGRKAARRGDRSHL